MSVPANFYDTYTVVASPVDDAETVIAILGAVTPLLPGLSVHLHGHASIAMDATATGAELAVRRTSLTGDAVEPVSSVNYDPAATLVTLTTDIEVVDDPGAIAGAVYVLTLLCTAATGPSTVGAVHFGARVC